MASCERGGAEGRRAEGRRTGGVILDGAGKVCDGKARCEALWRGPHRLQQARVLVVRRVQSVDEVLIARLGQCALVFEQRDQTVWPAGNESDARSVVDESDGRSRHLQTRMARETEAVTKGW